MESVRKIWTEKKNVWVGYHEIESRNLTGLVFVWTGKVYCKVKVES